jgi:hypothetical protein
VNAYFFFDTPHALQKEETMPNGTETGGPDQRLTCPECRAALKRRRSRTADECEMICGGCGQTFDVCDMDTVAELKKGNS